MATPVISTSITLCSNGGAFLWLFWMDSFTQPVRSIRQYVEKISLFLITHQFMSNYNFKFCMFHVYVNLSRKSTRIFDLFVICFSWQSHKSHLLMICYPALMERGEMMQCLGRFFSILGQNPSVSKSNQLQIVIFWFCLLIWGIFHKSPPKWWVIVLKSWTLTGYFFKLNWFICHDDEFQPAGIWSPSLFVDSTQVSGQHRVNYSYTF